MPLYNDTSLVSHGPYVSSLSLVLYHWSSHYCQDVNCRTPDIGHGN